MAPIYLGKRVVPSSLRYIENLAIYTHTNALPVLYNFLEVIDNEIASWVSWRTPHCCYDDRAVFTQPQSIVVTVDVIRDTLTIIIQINTEHSPAATQHLHQHQHAATLGSVPLHVCTLHPCQHKFSKLALHV